MISSLEYRRQPCHVFESFKFCEQYTIRKFQSCWSPCWNVSKLVSNRKFPSFWTTHHQKVSNLLVTATVGLICWVSYQVWQLGLVFIPDCKTSCSPKKSAQIIFFLFSFPSPIQHRLPYHKFISWQIWKIYTHKNTSAGRSPLGDSARKDFSWWQTALCQRLRPNSQLWTRCAIHILVIIVTIGVVPAKSSQFSLMVVRFFRIELEKDKGWSGQNVLQLMKCTKGLFIFLVFLLLSWTSFKYLQKEQKIPFNKSKHVCLTFLCFF